MLSKKLIGWGAALAGRLGKTEFAAGMNFGAGYTGNRLTRAGFSSAMGAGFGRTGVRSFMQGAHIGANMPRYVDNAIRGGLYAGAGMIALRQTRKTAESMRYGQYGHAALNAGLGAAGAHQLFKVARISGAMEDHLANAMKMLGPKFRV